MAMLGAGPLSGRLSGRYTPKLPLALGGGHHRVPACCSSGVAHGSELQVMFGSLVMSIGIGFAFAAMPNLIVESVPPRAHRRGDRLQPARALGRLLAGLADLGRDPGRQRRRAARRPTPATPPRSSSRRAWRSPPASSSALIPRAGGGAQAEPAPRRRMTRADAVRNRAAVLAAAEAVFAEHGTDAGVDLVAERAGVGKATVYRSFPTKEALVAEVASRQLDTWLAANAGIEGDAMTVLRQLLRAAAAAKVLGEGTGLASLAVARASAGWRRSSRSSPAPTARCAPTPPPRRSRPLFGGVCRVLAARGEADPAVWRRHAELVADAFRP